MVVSAALMPACSSADSSESTAADSATVDSGQLVGTWSVGGQTFTWGPDGTYDSDLPSETGTYAFDSSVVTMETDPDVVNECAGTTAQYSVTFVDADTLRMDVIDDPCQMRKNSVFGELQWTRVTE